VELGATFDTVAEQYDRARPAYPDELVDALVAAIEPPVLEIACGTGKLTRQLVERGVRPLCIEPGAHLGAIARDAATVITARFEDWEPDGIYGAVVCATAWHWLDPAVAPRKVHDVLRPGGTLAVIGTHHVFPPDADPFFRAVQTAYDAIGETVDDFPDVADVRHDDAVALRATGLFDVEDHEWLRVIDYDAESYIDVLGTYSGHLTMTDEQRDTIYGAVRDLAPPGRSIRKHHLFCLHLARRIG
jgi:SAM-dependent methyltransferase